MSRSSGYAAILREARSLIEDETRWLKDSFIEDKNGHSVTSGDLSACKFCLLGAVLHVAVLRGATQRLQVHEICTLVRDALPIGKHPGMTSEFNDFSATRHSDVLGVLDRAIKRAEESA